VAAGIPGLIRDAMAAYERGGFEAALPFTHPDLEVFAPPGMINAGESRGHAEAEDWNRAWDDAWEAQRYEIGEIEEVGPNRAVASALVTTTGRVSGVTTEMRQWWFFEVRDGKIARWHLYPDRTQAFALASESQSESG
jgi:ketosteroid isomerase-like protein